MDEIQRPSRSDRIGLYVTVVVAAVVIVGSVIGMAARLVDLGNGGDIAVTVPVDREPITLPIGPDGSVYPAEALTASVRVTDPAPATTFALWAEPIYDTAGICALAVIGAILLLRIAAGRVFERAAIRLFYVGSAVLAVWFVGSSILTNMTTNGALSAISDYAYDSITFEVGVAPFLGFLALGAVGAALEAGTRLRAETEGLV